MARSWILAANGTRARLFVKDGADLPVEVTCFTNPDGHAPGRQAHADRLPRSQESANSARHAIEPHLSDRDKSQQAFARLLCEALDEGRMARRFDELVLLAPPRFLGLLHARLGKELKRQLKREIGHDLTSLGAAQLNERLAAGSEPPSASQP
ncbi:host attachment protein [Tahibacter caeni]|uniref:host attachment protein n=1 Tax=Tahibacter caeni TaxID=1453545 RepID=UPI00214882C4|nr:host attachment protein [Tahibacter caeni]